MKNNTKYSKYRKGNLNILFQRITDFTILIKIAIIKIVITQ